MLCVIKLKIFLFIYVLCLLNSPSIRNLPWMLIIEPNQLETNQSHSKWRTKEIPQKHHKIIQENLFDMCVCVYLSDSLCLSDEEKIKEILTITKRQQ